MFCLKCWTWTWSWLLVNVAVRLVASNNVLLNLALFSNCVAVDVVAASIGSISSCHECSFRNCNDSVVNMVVDVDCNNDVAFEFIHSTNDFVCGLRRTDGLSVGQSAGQSVDLA